MIILNNEPLSKRTTFHIGGTAEKLYIPESEEELIQVSKDIYDRDHRVYVISGGSNLLINDDRVFPEVVCMAKACRELEQLHDGVFYIGASVRIQKAISFVNSFGYGGFGADRTSRAVWRDNLYECRYRKRKRASVHYQRVCRFCSRARSENRRDRHPDRGGMPFRSQDLCVQERSVHHTGRADHLPRDRPRRRRLKDTKKARALP